MAGGDRGLSLVVLDVFMPGLDGFGVLRALKEDPLTAKIPVLAVTANYREPDALELRRLGATGLLNKNLPLEEILFRINRILYPDKDAIRANPRVVENILVRYQIDESLFTGYSFNISTGGVFIRTVTPPAENTRLSSSTSPRRKADPHARHRRLAQRVPARRADGLPAGDRRQVHRHRAAGPPRHHGSILSGSPDLRLRRAHMWGSSPGFAGAPGRIFGQLPPRAGPLTSPVPGLGCARNPARSRILGVGTAFRFSDRAARSRPTARERLP
jgi:CheY-like chemotaxis protein